MIGKVWQKKEDAYGAVVSQELEIGEKVPSFSEAKHCWSLDDTFEHDYSGSVCGVNICLVSALKIIVLLCSFLI